MEEETKDGVRSGGIEVLGSGYSAGSERQSNMLVTHTLLAFARLSRVSVTSSPKSSE